VQHFRKARQRGHNTPLERMQYHLHFEKGDTESLNDRWSDSTLYYSNINDNMGKKSSTHIPGTTTREHMNS
jgi:hypothetical protein